MSDSNTQVERWQAPSFEFSAIAQEPVDLAELEKQAKAKGFEIGKWEGMEKSWSEVQGMVKRLSVLAEEMVHSFRSLDESVARELTVLAMTAAKQIVRRELLTDSSIVEEIVTDALETLSSLENNVEIYVNPNDLAIATQVAEKKLEGKAWKMLEDSNLLPGGCWVKTPTSFIDASIENQMEKVFEALAEVAENNHEP